MNPNSYSETIVSKASSGAEGMYCLLQAAADSWNRTCFIFAAVGRKHTGASPDPLQPAVPVKPICSLLLFCGKGFSDEKGVGKNLSETLIFLEFRPLRYGCHWLTNLNASRNQVLWVLLQMSGCQNQNKAVGSFLQEAAFKTPWGWCIKWTTKYSDICYWKWM